MEKNWQKMKNSFVLLALNSFFGWFQEPENKISDTRSTTTYIPLISISLTLPQQINRKSFPSSIFINLIPLLFQVHVTTKGQQTFKFSTASSILRSFNRFPVLKFQTIISPWLPQFDPDIKFSLSWSRHLNPYPVINTTKYFRFYLVK